MKPIIIKLPAREEAQPHPVAVPVQRKLRVAAYARVSTDHDSQQSSFDTQVGYYSDMIRSHNEWVLVKVYSDNGISATSTRGREGFFELMRDAEAGKIDYIITKSVSRFARNTVDSLVYIRRLRELGIEIYFEKENIRTMDPKGELFLTIMSSFAQEESRNNSENTTWGRRKAFAAGKASVAYSNLYGYRRAKEAADIGLPLEIIPEQAAIVRQIFKRYLEGVSLRAIARECSYEGKCFSPSMISYILSNEKYRGDALLQKQYTADYLTKKKRKNLGELPQYYIRGSHPAIIDDETFEQAQEERRRRKSHRLWQQNGTKPLAKRR